jgi:hypothetical protein
VAKPPRRGAEWLLHSATAGYHSCAGWFRALIFGNLKERLRCTFFPALEIVGSARSVTADSDSLQTTEYTEVIARNRLKTQTADPELVYSFTLMTLWAQAALK